MKISTLLLLTLALCSSCVKKERRTEGKAGETIVDEFIVAESPKLDDWKCDIIEDNRICYPGDWKPFKQNIALFFAQIIKDDQVSFFTIVRHDQKTLGLGADQYLKGVYNLFKTDSLEIFNNKYSAKRVNFQNWSHYYCEFETQIDNKDYITLVLIFERNGFLYDFSLKAPLSKKNHYAKLFPSIMQNIKLKNEFFFREGDTVKSFTEINIESM